MTGIKSTNCIPPPVLLVVYEAGSTQEGLPQLNPPLGLAEREAVAKSRRGNPVVGSVVNCIPVSIALGLGLSTRPIVSRL